MRIFLTGVGCVGKTTIGAQLAQITDRIFFDLDVEIERFFSMSIDQLQHLYWMPHDFRKEAAKALSHILGLPESNNAVIALPASGLMGGYWNVVKRTAGLKVVVLDTPENILQRIVFYDANSKLTDKRLTSEERPLYLKEIKKDIAYFKKSYARADLQISIDGLDVEQAAQRLLDQLALMPTGR
ncbi:MAG: shikimate kinase [Sedimenticola sp.]